MPRFVAFSKYSIDLFEEEELEEMKEVGYKEIMPIDETKEFAIVSQINEERKIEYVDNLLDFYRAFAKACRIISPDRLDQEVFCNDTFFVVDSVKSRISGYKLKKV